MLTNFVTAADLHLAIPEIFVCAAAFALLMVDLFLSPQRRGLTHFLALFILAGAAVLTVRDMAIEPVYGFANMFVRDTAIEEVMRLILVTNKLERKVLNDNTVIVQVPRKRRPS